MHNYSTVITCPVEHRALIESILSIVSTEIHELTVPLCDNQDNVQTHCSMHAWLTEDEYKRVYNTFMAGIDPQVAEWLGLDLKDTNQALSSCTASFKNRENWKGMPLEHFEERLLVTGLVRFTNEITM